MILPRAVAGPVLAMARPRRPMAERDAVRAAAAELAPLTARASAMLIARRVAAATIAEVDRDPADYLDQSLARLAAALDPSPVARLATCPEIDTAAIVRAMRLAAFEARGCRHLPETEWAAERKALAVALARTLAARYARHLRNRA